jgi:hypothetical protein
MSVKYWKVLVILLCFFCVGCGREKETDALKFKKEYEAYNDEYISLDLASNNLIEYSSTDEVNDLIKSGTGVVYFGCAVDNLSRRVVDVLFSAVGSSNLEKIYYLDSLDGVEGIEGIGGTEMPMVLFVLRGEIVLYHIGTIDDKVELDDEETVELYNIYLDGIHKVLEDACDERC